MHVCCPSDNQTTIQFYSVTVMTDVVVALRGGGGGAFWPGDTRAYYTRLDGRISSVWDFWFVMKPVCAGGHGFAPQLGK